MSAKFAFSNLQTTTAPGSRDGYLTFANAKGFAVGALAFLSDPSGNNTVEVEITAVSATLVGVVATSALPYSYGRTDFSAYDTGSTLDQYGPQVTPFGAGVQGSTARGSALYRLEIVSTRAGIAPTPTATGFLTAVTGQVVTNNGLTKGGYCLGSDGLLHFLAAHTNLALWSQDFTNGVWSRSSVTATLNAGIAPDGTNTANLISCAATHAEFQFFQSIDTGVGVATNTTFSVYVKKTATSPDFATIWLGGGSIYAIFQLSTATLVGVGGAISTNIEAVGNGWFRIQWTASISGGASLYVIKQAPDATSALPGFAWTATGTENLLVWGAQVQLDSAASKYIPTTSATVTLSPCRVEPNGLLCEPSVTNTFLSSVAIGDSNWPSFGSTLNQPVITLNSTDVQDPAGGHEASKLVFPAVPHDGTSYSFIAQNVLGRCCSLYARTLSGTVTLYIADNATHASTTMTITPTWQRFFLDRGSSFSDYWILGVDTRAANGNTGGTAGGTVYWWGAQSEGLQVPTSLVRTGAAGVTRPQDDYVVHNPLADLAQPVVKWFGQVTAQPAAPWNNSYSSAKSEGFLIVPAPYDSTGTTAANAWYLSTYNGGAQMFCETRDASKNQRYRQGNTPLTGTTTHVFKMNDNNGAIGVILDGVDVGGGSIGPGTGIVSVQNAVISIGNGDDPGMLSWWGWLRDIIVDDSL